MGTRFRPTGACVFNLSYAFEVIGIDVLHVDADSLLNYLDGTDQHILTLERGAVLM